MKELNILKTCLIARSKKRNMDLLLIEEFSFEDQVEVSSNDVNMVVSVAINIQTNYSLVGQF